MAGGSRQEVLPVCAAEREHGHTGCSRTPGPPAALQTQCATPAWTSYPRPYPVVPLFIVDFLVGRRTGFRALAQSLIFRVQFLTLLLQVLELQRVRSQFSIPGITVRFHTLLWQNMGGETNGLGVGHPCVVLKCTEKRCVYVCSKYGCGICTQFKTKVQILPVMHSGCFLIEFCVLEMVTINT